MKLLAVIATTFFDGANGVVRANGGGGLRLKVEKAEMSTGVEVYFVCSVCFVRFVCFVCFVRFVRFVCFACFVCFLCFVCFT